MISRLGILFMRLIAPLPLGLLRAMGAALGMVLYVLVVPRRRVARRNLELCFPQWSAAHREQVLRQHFIAFAQAWLDRSWLWHGSEEMLRRRLVLTGAVRDLAGNEPTVVFAPHFVGMDAGLTALLQQVPRRFCGIYTIQSNAVLDAWIFQGRNRFGNLRALRRADGVRPLVTALRAGEAMYLLPDMNYGADESIFVPFYGVAAATVPSLPRFAKLGRARVVPVVTSLTPSGYEVRVHEAWACYPGDDVEADTALMNERLQGYIDPMPAQYYWVHKRFKSRPAGDPPVY